MDSELAELKRVSAELGRDPELVQAGGGNTSLKIGDRLIVKASGKWLANAVTDDVFVSVSLAEQRAGCPRPTTLDGTPSPLRSSIETAFHAILEDRVVLHTHSTAVLARALSKTGAAELNQPLSGLPWAWIPYAKPGSELAGAIGDAAGSGARIFVLANHGIVACAGTVQTAAARLADVETRLRGERRPSVETPDLRRLAAVAATQDAAYEIAPSADWHSLGLDPARFQLVTRGSLYPDHVVFLGPAVWYVKDGGLENASTLADPRKVPLILVEGAGCLVRRDLPPAARALVECLASVASQARADVQARYLTLSDEAALLDWDAEKYRQKLAPAS